MKGFILLVIYPKTSAPVPHRKNRLTTNSAWLTKYTNDKDFAGESDYRELITGYKPRDAFRQLFIALHLCWL